MTVLGVLRGPAARRRLLVEAAGLLALIRIGLRTSGYASVERRLSRWAGHHAAPDAADDVIERVVRAIEGVSRRLPRMTCLVRALATHAMLSRRGVRARVHIGVRPNTTPSAPFDAHAWVETSDGRIVIGDVPELADFQPLEAGNARLVRGLAALLRRERVAWAALGGDSDIVLAYCEDEDLTGLVHQAVVRGLAAGSPPAFVDRLASRARLDAAIELARGQEIRRVLERLATVGVRAVLFKGTALAYSRYPRPALRPRADTDLSIPRAQREMTCAALIDLGYTVSERSEGDWLFRQVELQRRDQHGVVHAFDVHWQISNQERFAQMFDEDELWRRAEPVEALGPAARAVGAADALLISCMHPVMHHRGDARLIWIHDTHLLAASSDATQWAAFIELARAKSVAAVCLYGLEVAREYFGTAIPASVLRGLEDAARRREPSAEYLAPGRTWRDETASNFSALPGWRARARLLREMALPAPAYMRRAYALDRSMLGWVLLPALYAHRGLKAVRKK